MQEPIRDVPKIRVSMWTEEKTKCVAEKATSTDRTIEHKEQTRGVKLLKTKSNISTTRSIEIVEITDISHFVASYSN